MPHIEQRSFDQMGTPLRDVTFCVVDLETTGTSPHSCMITEIGAVKLRGGECLGTYQTMVDPGCAIPPEITVITGITESMVARAPRIESVTPSLLEFMADAVVVGHNVRFDISFLNATLAAQGREPLANRSIDTLALARRLLKPEVPNCKLGTLADRFHLQHRPSHRALDDALATGDLLHLLIERSAAMGATGLDDLASLPTMAGSPQAAKLRLTEHLPRSPGVYLFRSRGGTILYVGKAANLRARVRSYFSSDQRRMVAQLLKQTTSIDHRVCANGLEAAVLEIRLIHEHMPMFNKQGTTSSRYPYIRVTFDHQVPRFKIVAKVSSDGDLHLGPLPSRKRARLVIEAIEAAMSLSPWAGPDGGSAHRSVHDWLVEALTRCPGELLGALSQQIEAVARVENFEDAAELRDRAAALSLTLSRQRMFRTLAFAGSLTLSTGSSRIHIVGGLLADAAPNDPPPSEPAVLPPAKCDADEMLCVATWLASNAHRVRVEAITGTLSEPASPIPTFMPKGESHPRRVISRRSTQPKSQSAAASASSLASARPSSIAAEA